MMMFLLLADGLVSTPHPVVLKDKFDLADAIPRACRVAPRDGDIVVCARNNERYRVRPHPQERAYVEVPVKAAFRISDNVQTAIEVESTPLAGGAVSKRTMVRLKIGL